MSDNPSSSTPLLADTDVPMDAPSSSTAPPPSPPAEPVEDWSDIPQDVLQSTPDEIKVKARLIENDIKVGDPLGLRVCSESCKADASDSCR